MAEVIPFVVAALAAAAGFAAYNSIDNEADIAIQEAKWNRDMLNRQASNEAYKNGLEEDQARREIAFSQARTRAGLLQAGIGTHLGSSAIAVSGQAAKFGELDALNIRHDGDLSVLSLLTQAEGQSYRIEGLRSQRSSAKQGQILKGLGDTLSEFSGAGGFKPGAQTTPPVGGSVQGGRRDIKIPARRSGRGGTSPSAGRGVIGSDRFSSPVATSGYRPSIG